MKIWFLAIFLFSLFSPWYSKGIELYGDQRLDGTQGGNANYWLIIAAHQEDEEAFYKLIEDATNINHVDTILRSGPTMNALMAATIQGNEEFVRALLNKGANPNIKSNPLKMGINANERLNEAKLKEFPAAILKLTFGNIYPAFPPLFVAVAMNNESLVNLLLDYGSTSEIEYIGNSGMDEKSNAAQYSNNRNIKNLISDYNEGEKSPTYSLAQFNTVPSKATPQPTLVKKETTCPLEPTETKRKKTTNENDNLQVKLYDLEKKLNNLMSRLELTY